MAFKKTLLFIFLFTLSVTLYSQRGEGNRNAPQGTGKISGKIIDSLTKQPVEYASVSLVKEQNDKVIDGATTDNSGVFKIMNVPNGNYKLLIYFIGYKTATKTDIKITDADQEIKLGAIKLVNQQVQLKEVTVEVEKSLIENKIDKLVYNAEKDITSQGGVATDILKKVPMVAVNVDGSVELQGNSNIRFLINGKPSSVFGNNITDVLATIPASQIQSIEVITSPGAKYDAEGTGGIINIILKKTEIQGINGNVSLTGGSRLQNGSINLAARKGKFGVNTFLSGNAQLSSSTLNFSDRESSDPNSGSTTSLLQNGKSNFTRTGYQAGLSFDWSPTDKNNFTGGFSFNDFGNDNKGTTSRQSIFRDASGNVLSDVNNDVISNSNFNNKAYDWNLNYKRKFKKEGQELDLQYNASTSNNYSYYLQKQKFVTPDSVFSGSQGKNPGTDMQNNIALNYTHPVSDKLLFETGLKTVLYNINSNSKVYLLDPASGNYNFSDAQSNSVDYSRNVYAAYISTTFKLKFLDVKAGIRDEYTETQATFSNGGKASIAPYNTIVPSGILSHTFKKNQTLKLSYSYRIQRPDYRDLNPFVNASDPKNVTTGNPNLKPEYAHNIELGYSRFFEKGININVNAFYRGNRADIQGYTRFYPSYLIGDSTYNNVSVTTRENIGTEDNFGLNIFVSATIKKKFTLRSNISLFQRYIYNSITPGANISGFNYRANLNLSYQITSTFIVEAFGNFNSQRLNVQGRQPSFTTYNFALRKQFYHKKMSIAFTATNPFDKYVNQKSDTKGTNFTTTTLRQLPYRSFGLNFTWKFGKLEFKRPREEDANLTNPMGQGGDR
jgi:outer membrane receptor protein involved in Fe transport